MQQEADRHPDGQLHEGRLPMKAAGLRYRNDRYAKKPGSRRASFSCWERVARILSAVLSIRVRARAESTRRERRCRRAAAFSCRVDFFCDFHFFKPKPKPTSVIIWFVVRGRS